MAKCKYSADSASLPQSPSPSFGDKMGAFKTANVPAPVRKDTPVPTTFVVTGTNAYIGESADLGRRLSKHGAVHRTAGQSGTCPPTPTSID